jgi:hypothetical protein
VRAPDNLWPDNLWADPVALERRTNAELDVLDWEDVYRSQELADQLDHGKLESLRISPSD